MVKKKAERAHEREWPGLETITDGDAARRFIESVEEAFQALHQPFEDPGEGDFPEDTPVDPVHFAQWAQRVEDRLEYMGLNHVAHGLPDKPGPPIETAALLIWTKRVRARFAAFGQLLPDPTR